MRINTNLTALNTYSQYTANNNKIASAVGKLSSGYAINNAADNAAGLAISEKMRAQIRGLNKASSNAQDAISLVQTAEGALDSSTKILQRMRELAVQSSSDTNEDGIDRAALQDEFKQLQQELNDIAKNTTFNKKNLLDGSLATSKTSVTNVDLANSGMAISTGNVSAGSYTFGIGIQQETAAIAASTGTTTASLGSTAAATFSTAAGIDPATTGALYNGNYSLSSAVESNGDITVTASGDNGQTFKATLLAATIDGVSGTNFTSGESLTLNFESNSGAGDGFGVTLTLSAAASTTTNGLNALADSINDVTVSVDGGVDAKAATFGVYASMTGGDSVKLQAGDSSVTFSNGVTMGFDKLAATDAAVSLTSAAVDVADLAAATTATTAGVTATASTQVLALDDIATDYVAGDIKTYTLQIGSNNYSYTTTGQEADATAVADAIGASLVDSTLSLTSSGGVTATFTAAYSSATHDVTFSSATTINTVDTAGLGAFSAVSSSASVTTASLSVGLANKTGTTTGAGNDASVAQAGHLAKTTDTTFDVSKEANAGLTFQVGANDGDKMTINIEKMDSQTLGVNSAKVGSRDAAEAAISVVDGAINKVSAMRAGLGAVQNRLDYKIDNLSTSAENLTSAESQIRDVDMAKEMTNFTNANILQQAATAMLAQANSLPQNVLSLIGG